MKKILLVDKARLTKHEYLLNMAKAASLRATCPDMKVGCVIATEDGHVLSIGYNGSTHGSRHCRVKNGKCLDNGPNHLVVHAEANAIAHAAKQGVRLSGSTAYITAKPCSKCKVLLKQAGIIKINYPRKRNGHFK